MAFLDIEKAINRISRKTLWRRLEYRELGNELILTLKNIYKNNVS